MREIKFKYLWQGQWYYIDLYKDNTRLAWQAYEERNKTSPLLEYCGLKDKNGIPIYESDIVKWDDMTNGERWRVAVVEINPDIQFRIVRVNLDIVQSAKEGYVFHFGRFIYTDTHNHLEVIGNIYENPELLNK